MVHQTGIFGCRFFFFIENMRRFSPPDWAACLPQTEGEDLFDENKNRILQHRN